MLNQLSFANHLSYSLPFFLKRVRFGDTAWSLKCQRLLTTRLSFQSFFEYLSTLCHLISVIKLYFNPLTAIGTLGTKFSKPHYCFGIGSFLNPINYFDYKKGKLLFSEEILIF